MAFPPTHPALEKALAAQGYAEPTPVQREVLEAGAHGADLLVSAQTGSGKTVAFGLAMASTLLGDADRFGQAGAPLALVIAPTRELALQVARELTWLYAPAGAKVTVCVGGMDARAEQRALSYGAHIVVGTPGRLRDHLERGNLDLSELKVAVLDEADEMLDLGFREDLEFILDTTPEDRRTLLFSATLARDIVALAKRYQTDAIRIDTTNANVPHGDIEYRAIRIAPNEMERAVVNVLRFFEAPGALVFCATRDAVRRLHSNLRERGFDAVGLSGELSQRERADALQALRDGRARVCVATDVAARGLDLPDLGLVIHAELPVNKAGLLHRSGRTGRAGKKGTSVLLVPYTRRRKAEQMLASANIEAHWQGPPSADEIRQRDEARLLEDSVMAEAPSEEDIALAKRLLETKTAEEIAATLIRLRRAKLPEPEEIYDDARMRDAQQTPLRDRAPGERPQREGRVFSDDTVWYRVTIGRRKNADPKWLLPLICRLGHVTKKDIGLIRIFDFETKFEITKEASDKFAEAILATAEDDIKIEASSPPGASQPRHEGRDSYEERPRGEKPGYPKKKPYAPRDDAPAAEGERAYPPKKPYAPKGDKPYAPREEKAYSKKPYVDSNAPYTGPALDEVDRSAVSEDRPRPEKAGYPKKKPYVPREDGPAAADGDRAYPPKKPYAAKGDKPYAPRGDTPAAADGERSYPPKKPYAAKSDKPYAPRGEKTYPPKKPFAGAGEPYKGKAPYAPKGPWEKPAYDPVAKKPFKGKPEGGKPFAGKKPFKKSEFKPKP